MEVLSELFSAGKEHIYSSSYLFLTVQLFLPVSYQQRKWTLLVDTVLWTIHGRKNISKKGQIKDSKTPWTTDSEIVLRKHP